MRLFVRNLTDKTILLDVAADDTVADVKTKLQEREGVPANEQRLIYAGRQLADGRTLADYRIPPESTCSLLLTLKGGFQVFVEHHAQDRTKTITVVVEPVDTILSLKQKIAERINVRPEQQSLMYAGKPLEDSKTIFDYHIKRDATLHLSARLPGGEQMIV